MEKHDLLSILELVFYKLAIGAHQQAQVAEQPTLAQTFRGWQEIFTQTAKDLDELHREILEVDKSPKASGTLN